MGAGDEPSCNRCGRMIGRFPGLRVTRELEPGEPTRNGFGFCRCGAKYELVAA